MTIVEFQANEFERVLPLYRMQRARFPLISAVIQNRQRGQVFADDRERPRSALIVTNFGFTFFIGQENESSHAEFARLLATSGVFKPSYLLWYWPPTNWQRRLDAFPAVVRRRERVRLEFHPNCAAWLGEEVQSPGGFQLTSLSLELIPKTDRFGVKVESRFWASATDFVEHGLGVCLLKNDEVVSLCYAAAVVDGLAEVDVATADQFRGQGLATVVTRQFIKQCVARRIAPTWDCFAYNTASMKLASSLGFEPSSNYPFYSFNVPVKW